MRSLYQMCLVSELAVLELFFREEASNPFLYSSLNILHMISLDISLRSSAYECHAIAVSQLKQAAASLHVSV